MELFNELPDERAQDVEDFLAFIPIYESKRRTRSLMRLLKDEWIEAGFQSDRGALLDRAATLIQQ